MKPKLYLETTIPSYLAARVSGDLVIAANQRLTQEWWDSRRAEFELYVSEVVLGEAALGDPNLAARRLSLVEGMQVLAVDRRSEALTASLLAEGPLPVKAATDAAHIALASVYECAYLLTWNCRHIANAEIQAQMRRLVARYGYELPVMCTPAQLMGDVDVY